MLALGTAIGDTFELAKLRYHKIIIATDADVDGAHIRTLLLTLFYRYFKQLVDGGFIYIAQPPLYKIKKGKDVHYSYSDKDKDKLLGKDGVGIEDVLTQDSMVQEEEATGDQEVKSTETGGTVISAKSKVPRVFIQRYKGLGEMNAEELWETTMDPQRRLLKRVTVDDAQEADSVFEVLMGTDVPARKSFIQSNAKMANLDI